MLKGMEISRMFQRGHSERRYSLVSVQSVVIGEGFLFINHLYTLTSIAALMPLSLESAILTQTSLNLPQPQTLQRFSSEQ